MDCSTADNDIQRLWAETGIGSRVLFNQPLAAYTSLGVGGPAQVLVFPHPHCGQGMDELTKTCEFARQHKLPLLVLGGGTNLLVRDEGVPGVVVCLKEGFKHIAREDSFLVAEAGAKLAEVINFALEEELGGLEPLAGIPGTLGGAVYMNAGTSKGCIAQMLEEVKLLSADHQLEVLPKDRLGFGYRQSHLSKGSIILEAKLRLTPRPREEIREEMNEVLSQRANCQPIGERSAGCIFKNPSGEYAGELIEAVGLKGYCLGDAQVSDKHANFIINKGSASAKDILQLIEVIKNQVWRKKGVSLKEEVIVVGQEQISSVEKI